MVVIAALGMIAIIGGVSLVLEGGNAYAHQRVAQNAADAVANAGATTIAERLGGAWRTDDDVHAAMDLMADANDLNGYRAFYTDVFGALLDATGVVTDSEGAAEQVGPHDGSAVIPAHTQGVRVSGSQDFGTTFARVIGINQFTASAGATAVAGALTGGNFMPVVFPVSLADCDGSGDTVIVDDPWRLGSPGDMGATHPKGQEWIVPLCKSGDGSFMILDLDPDKSCYEEVMNPTSIQFAAFPVDIHTDTGNDCAKKVEEAIADDGLQGKVVLIPICDDLCSTEAGNAGYYHIIRITAFFVDYISYSNGGNNPACEATTSPTYGTSLVNITGGNGSSSCLVGWFVRYVTSGPVGAGTINNGEAIGVQLIR
jgi:hypothetical protein